MLPCLFVCILSVTTGGLQSQECLLWSLTESLLTLELETGLVHISVSSAFAWKVILHCAPILVLLRWVVSRGSGRPAHCLGNTDFFRGKVSALTQILSLPVGAYTSVSAGNGILESDLGHHV